MKIVRSLFLVTFFSVACAAFADETVDESAYYRITYEDGVSQNADLKNIVDAYFAYFNNVFHFDKNGPGFKYQIRVFGSKEAYTAFVQAKTGTDMQPKGEATFLRYDEKANSVLAMLADGVLQPEFIRQLFVQYIYAFTTVPQRWVLTGFPLYFENTTWKSGSGVVRVANDNPWLEPAKAFARDESKRLTVQQILEANDSSDYSLDVFMPQAFLLASFLVDSTSVKCSRLFFDGLSAIKNSPDKGNHFLEYKNAWMEADEIQIGFNDYLAKLRGVNEILTEGIQKYTDNATDEAIATFQEALKLSPNNSVAMYYIGLSMYKQRRYSDADIWYKKSLAADDGTNRAYIYWALGTAAVADRRNSDALEYLQEAKKSDEQHFGSRVDELVAKIK